MDTNSPTPKRSTWKKVFYIILIVIPILILLETSIGIIIGVKGINYLSYQKLVEQRSQITGMVTNLLHLSTLEPGEKLHYLISKSDITIDMTVIAHDYPEIIGIYQIDDFDKVTSLLQLFPSPQIQDRVTQTAPILLEELDFINTYWDPTWKHSKRLIEVENQSLLFNYFQSNTDTYLIITDIEKLKDRLPDIFNRWQKRLIIFADYFLPFPDFGAQIKFFDRSGSNFYTLGDPRGTGWDNLWEQDLNSGYLPWKMTVQLFPENELLLSSAIAKGKTPWGYVVKLIIGIGCIILLPWGSRRY